MKYLIENLSEYTIYGTVKGCLQYSEQHAINYYVLGLLINYYVFIVRFSL